MFEMSLDQIKEVVPTLKTMDDKAAYDKGLELLKALSPYRHIIDRNEYRRLNNAIQEERFR